MGKYFISPYLFYIFVLMKKIKLPNNITQELIVLPEHGMGYQIVEVDLSNGITFQTKVFNCEYLEIPESVNVEEIKKVNYIY